MSQTELRQSATSLPQDTPANHSPLPKGVEDGGQMMPATYGRTYERSLPRAGRLGLFARMFTGMCRWGSTMYSMTWMDLGTPRGRLLSRLAVSMRRTSARDSGSCHAGRMAWPTPLASDSKRSGHHEMDTNGSSPALPRQVVLRERFPTPTAWDATGYRAELDENERRVSKKGVAYGATLQSLVLHRAGCKEDLRLNPAWVEWLMGYPAGWTSLPFQDSLESTGDEQSKSGD